MGTTDLTKLSTEQLDAHVSTLRMQLDAVEAARAVGDALPTMLEVVKGMKQDLGAQWGLEDFVKVTRGEGGRMEVLADAPDPSKVDASQIASHAVRHGIDVGEALETAAEALASDVSPFAARQNNVLDGLTKLRDQMNAAGDALGKVEEIDQLIRRVDKGSELLGKALYGGLSDDDLVDAFTEWVGMLGDVAVKATKAVPGMEETLGEFVKTYVAAVESVGPTIKQLARAADDREHALKIWEDALSNSNDPQVTSLTAPRPAPSSSGEGALEGLQRRIQDQLAAATSEQQRRADALQAELDRNTQREADQLLEQAKQALVQEHHLAWISPENFQKGQGYAAEAFLALTYHDEKKPGDAAGLDEWQARRDQLTARWDDMQENVIRPFLRQQELLGPAMAAIIAKFPHIYTPDKLARIAGLGGTWAEAIRIAQRPTIAAGAAAAGQAVPSGAASTGVPTGVLVGGTAAILGLVGLVAVMTGGGDDTGEDIAATPSAAEAVADDPTEAIAIGDVPVAEVPSSVGELVGSAGFGPPWIEVAPRPDGVDRWVADVENFPTDAGFEQPAEGQVAQARAAGVVATANRQWEVLGGVDDRSDDDAYATVFAADVGTPAQAQALVDHAVQRALGRPDGATASATSLDGVQVVSFQYFLSQCPRGECFDQDPWDVHFVLFAVDRYAVLASVQVPVAAGAGPDEAVEVARQLLQPGA